MGTCSHSPEPWIEVFHLKEAETDCKEHRASLLNLACHHGAQNPCTGMTKSSSLHILPPFPFHLLLLGCFPISCLLSLVRDQTNHKRFRQWGSQDKVTKIPSLIWGIRTEYGLSRLHYGKEPACQCRRHGRCKFDPWVRKIPWSRIWQLQYSCLENPMDRGARWATFHGVTKCWTLSNRAQGLSLRVEECGNTLRQAWQLVNID